MGRAYEFQDTAATIIRDDAVMNRCLAYVAVRAIDGRIRRLGLGTSDHKSLVVVALVSHEMGLEKLLVVAIGRTAKGDGGRGEWTTPITIETTAVVELPIRALLIAAN